MSRSSHVAEKSVVKWILKLDDYGFSPRVDILMGLVQVVVLAKEVCMLLVGISTLQRRVRMHVG